jgi:MYXO-CTERM domain-containing protein
MRPLNGVSLLLALLVLVPSRVASASIDSGGDTSGEAGAPSEPIRDAGASDASAELPPEYAPLKCDGSLCDTTTGETTCDMSQGRSAKGGAWPFAMVLALAAVGIRRRARTPLRRLS